MRITLTSPGQRYNIIVEANAEPGDYWMRTEIPGGPGGCGRVVDRAGNVTGILRYDSHSTALPTSSKNDYPSDCHDEPQELLHPILPWTVDPHPQNDVHNNTYEAGISEVQFHKAFRWDLTDTPMWLDFGNPTILNLQNTSWNPEYAVIDCTLLAPPLPLPPPPTTLSRTTPQTTTTAASSTSSSPPTSAASATTSARSPPATRSTCTATTSRCSRSPTRRTTSRATRSSSTSPIRRVATSFSCRATASSRWRSSRTIRGYGWCIATSLGMLALVSDVERFFPPSMASLEGGGW